MAYLNELPASQGVSESDVLHIWNEQEERDEAVSIEQLKEVFGSGISWAGTLTQYQQQASTIENDTVIHIYDNEGPVTPGEAGIFYKLNNNIYPVILAGSGLLAIRISNSDYKQLTNEQKHDLTKVYFIYDLYQSSVVIDDAAISLDSLWSSNKVNTEINAVKTLIQSLGLSVVNGKICQTYQEV